MVNLSMKMDHNSTEVNSCDVVADIVDGSLIEKVWHDLDRQVPRDRVSCVIFEVALGFQDATVKTFLPILVHRRALERLRQEINESVSTDGLTLGE